LVSVPVTVSVNDRVEQVYGSLGVAVAEVESAFQTLVTTPVIPPGIGDVRLNVARIYQWT
jgi:hypothetical protein